MTETCPCCCHGNGAYPPPCDQPGGCGPHEPEHRCQRGPDCTAHELDDQGRKLGAPCDRPLCDSCERAAARALADAPALYVDLRNATLTTTAAARSEMVSASPGTPLPLNGRALDLTEQLHWLLTMWEDEVRVIARLSDAQREGKREGRQVQEAATLLAAHLTAWISAPVVAFSVARWVPEMEQSGAQAVAQLIGWRGTVRRLPGLDAKAPQAVRRYQQRCPACGVRAITHRAGDDLMQCQNCGATQEYLPTLPREADYRLEESA